MNNPKKISPTGYLSVEQFEIDGNIVLYIRKQGSYTENRIYPFADISELRSDIFREIRKLESNQRADHPWIMMDDMEMLKSAGLYKRDLQSGEEGIKEFFTIP